jgi:hypothetical protein
LLFWANGFDGDILVGHGGCLGALSFGPVAETPRLS